VMGGSNLAAYQDLTATGTVTSLGGNAPTGPYAIVVRAKGTHELRTEISKPNGTQVWAGDGNSGCMNYGQTQRPVAFENLLSQRVDFFPVLSLLAEYNNSNMNVQNAGATTIDGRPVYIIALSFVPSGLILPGVQTASLTQRLFYIDQQNYLVLKMQFTRYADNAPGTGLATEMYFSNYKTVNGLLLPTKIDSYMESKQFSTMTFSAISLNTGLQDSQFTIPCGGQNAN
jgi:hypothetical protein